MSLVTVEDVTSRRWPDLTALFAGSTVLRGCWCMWPRVPRGDMQPGPENETRLKAIVDGGGVPGPLAYVDGVPADWCSVGPYDHYGRFSGEGAEPDVWVIACLFIDASHRGRHVGPALVAAAVDHAARNGARRVAALPRGWRPDDDPATIDMVLGIFRRAGFADQPDAEAPMRFVKNLA